MIKSYHIEVTNTPVPVVELLPWLIYLVSSHSCIDPREDRLVFGKITCLFFSMASSQVGIGEDALWYISQSFSSGTF